MYLAVSLIGLFLVAISFVALAVRTKGDQVISFNGFGVTFEIKPCNRRSKSRKDAA